jgi:hypothetical protein
MMLKFEYQIKDWHGDDDWSVIDAFSHRDAAKEAAAEHFHRDPCNPNHFDPTIFIRKIGEAEAVEFQISAETDVNFYARPVRKEQKNERSKI